MKAIREGRVPSPGPPGGEEQESSGEIPSNVAPSISEFPSPPSNFTAPLPPSSPQQPKASTSAPHFDNNVPTQPTPPPPTIPQAAPAPAPAPVVVTPHIAAAPAAPPPPPASNVSGAQVANAQKYSKWAISALDYDDIKTARLQLLSALNEIGFNQENNFGY